jgi:hypothetical protein
VTDFRHHAKNEVKHEYWQAKRLEGKVFTVRYIDSARQIHLEETGLALINYR